MLGLLGLSGFKMAILAAGAAVVATMIGGLYWQNTILKNDLLISEANGARLEMAIDTQKGAVIAAQDNAEQWKVANENLQDRMEELAQVSVAASAEGRRLGILWAKHPFTADALARPDRIERLVDRGSRRALSVLHDITAGNLRLSGGTGEAPGSPDTSQPAADSD